MRKLFILTGLMIAFVFATELRAQTKNVFLHQKETMELLGLNPEQQKQVVRLTSQSFVDIGNLQKDTTLTKFDRNTQISQVYKKRDADYKEVLTPEQWAKLIEMREAAKRKD